MLTAAALGEGLDYLRTVLKAWKQNRGNSQDKHVFVLQHEYTPDSLRLENLKGADLAVVWALLEVGHDVGFSVFLAGIENQRFGQIEAIRWEDDWRHRYDRYDDYGEDSDEDSDNESSESEKPYHKMYEADEESWKLTSVVDMTGRELLEDLEKRRDDIIQTDAFENVEPEEDDVQYTGNEGATAIHWYRSTVSIRMRKMCTFTLIDP